MGDDENPGKKIKKWTYDNGGGVVVILVFKRATV